MQFKENAKISKKQDLYIIRKTTKISDLLVMKRGKSSIWETKDTNKYLNLIEESMVEITFIKKGWKSPNILMEMWLCKLMKL